jgi:hypothetical protein
LLIGVVIRPTGREFEFQFHEMWQGIGPLKHIMHNMNYFIF